MTSLTITSTTITTTITTTTATTIATTTVTTTTTPQEIVLPKFVEYVFNGGYSMTYFSEIEEKMSSCFEPSVVGMLSVSNPTEFVVCVRYSNWDDIQIPSGTANTDELTNHFVKCAYRECGEELCIRPHSFHHLKSYQKHNPDYNWEWYGAQIRDCNTYMVPKNTFPNKFGNKVGILITGTYDDVQNLITQYLQNSSLRPNDTIATVVFLRIDVALIAINTVLDVKSSRHVKNIDPIHVILK